MNDHKANNRVIKDVSGIEKFLGIPLDAGAIAASKSYPVKVSEYYLDLVNKSDPFVDPIFKQCVPSVIEIQESQYNEDPQNENMYEVVPKLIHRYPDRALILTTNQCSTYCRFCFRKKNWKKGKKQERITTSELSKIVEYIRKHSDITEILLSGGDFLTLPYVKIKAILEEISAIASINVIRIASRVPVTSPGLVTRRLVNMISKFEKTWLITHFNHPKELTKEAISACSGFISKGIPVLNQTVLLKGVNDSEKTLKTLFQLLVKNKIKPLYLFHVDPVKGVTHFATGIDKGLGILNELRGNLSSLATPTFSIDLPDGVGKISLLPSYTKDGICFEVDNVKVDYYPNQ